MKIRFCIDDECRTYIIPDRYRNDVLEVIKLMDSGNFMSAGLKGYSLFKKLKKEIRFYKYDKGNL